MGVKGKVYIISAGPGAPDLITLRGRRALEKADLILMDALLPASFLGELGVSTVKKTVQRLHRDHCQDKINRILIDSAQAGKNVARLKGGDALIFGRGAEEAAALSEEGIEWEIIPGLTSGIAAPALAGYALTSRGGGRSFAVTTGHCAGGEVNTRLPSADSLVLYMGVKALGELIARLLDEGWSPETPVVIIERASQEWERETKGTLRTITADVLTAGIAAPALFLIGEAARTRIANGRPAILFTGLDPTNFHSLGRLLHWPALQIVRHEEDELSSASALDLLDRGRISHVVFTSKVGVATFLEDIRAQGRDARQFQRTTIVTAGEGTAQRLREYGLIADKVPSDGGSAGILKALTEENPRHVLLVQGTHAPGGLEEELRKRGAEVTRVAVHRIVRHPELGRPLPEHDVIYFASPSGVRAYFDAYGKEAFRRTVWSIGDVTRQEVEKLGFASEIVNPCAAAAERAMHV